MVSPSASLHSPRFDRQSFAAAQHERLIAALKVSRAGTWASVPVSIDVLMAAMTVFRFIRVDHSQEILGAGRRLLTRDAVHAGTSSPMWSSGMMRSARCARKQTARDLRGRLAGRRNRS